MSGSSGCTEAGVAAASAGTTLGALSCTAMLFRNDSWLSHTAFFEIACFLFLLGWRLGILWIRHFISLPQPPQGKQSRCGRGSKINVDQGCFVVALAASGSDFLAAVVQASVRVAVGLVAVDLGFAAAAG